MFWSTRSRVDLIKWVSNVRQCVRLCVRMSVHPSTKSFFDLNEIWRVVKGRWLMHDGTQYDLIQGQGHKLFRVGNSSIFKSYLLRYLQWALATDHWFLNYGIISKFDWVGFLICPSFCVTWLWTWQRRHLWRVVANVFVDVHYETLVYPNAGSK